MDTDYYVPIKIETQRMIRGAERDYETILGDYKEVNGWYLPFSIENGVKGNPNRQKIDVLEDRSERADGRRALFVEAGQRSDRRASQRSTEIALRAHARPPLATRHRRQPAAAHPAPPSTSTPTPSPASARATSARPR